MSFGQFIIHGAHGPLQKQRRDHYEDDVIETTGSSGSFNGKIKTLSTDDETKQVLIDNTVKVTTVADRVRDQAKGTWSRLKAESHITFTATLIVGLLAGAAAIAIGVVLPPLWPVAVAVGAVALGILAVSFFTLYRAVVAGRQLAQWKDPLPGMQAQRQKVGRLGFDFAYRTNLKDSIVAPAELKALWFQGMDHYADRFAKIVEGVSTLKVSLVREFMQKAPIASGPFQYTFGAVDKSASTELKCLDELSDRFEKINTQFGQVRKQTEKLKQRVNEEKRLALKDNDYQLELMLQPYKMMIEPHKAALLLQKANLEGTLSQYRGQLMAVEGPAHVHATVVTPSGHVVPSQRRGHNPHVIFIEGNIKSAECQIRHIDAELLRLDIIYNGMTAPVRQLHRQNERRIETWAGRELDKIREGEDKLLVNFYKPLKALLEDYQNRNASKESDAPKKTEEVPLPLKPKAPALKKKYEPADYNPSWKDVIDELQWKSKKSTLVKEQLVPSHLND